MFITLISDCVLRLMIYISAPQGQVKSAVMVMVLLGTGWVFGILMNIPEPSIQIILQYFFIVINSTQVSELDFIAGAIWSDDF